MGGNEEGPNYFPRKCEEVELQKPHLIDADNGGLSFRTKKLIILRLESVCIARSRQGEVQL